MQSLVTDYRGQPFSLSPAQITEIVNHAGSHPTSTITPRLKLLDRNLKPIATGVRGPYGDEGDITDLYQSGTITCDTTQDVQRKFDFQMKKPTSFTYNALRHRIQVFLDYWDASAQILFEVPMGIFGTGFPTESIDDAGSTLSGTLQDLTAGVARQGFLNTYTIPAGTNVVEAVKRILTMDYLPLSQDGTGQTPDGLDDAGPNIPLSRINITPTSLVTPATLTYDRRANKFAAVNQLLSGIVYRRLWADEIGDLRSSPLPDFSRSVPAIGWTYNNDHDSVIDGPITWDIANPGDLANIVAVFSENNNTTAFSSIKYNNRNTISSLCLSVLGEAFMKVIEDSSIPDQASCELRAYVELTYAALKADRVTLPCFPNPFHQAYDTLGMTITDRSGSAILSNPTGWEELGWSYTLGGLVQRSLGRIAIL